MKTAVYRTSGDSPLVPALIQCAEDGKQSVCLVELKARFDEHRNIEWSRALEQAGVHVVYGFPDLKVHAKMTLVVRREGDVLRRYVHVGTGNYHAVTARSYEDLSLFTADAAIAEDIAVALQLPDRVRAPAALPEDPRRAVRTAVAPGRADPGGRHGRRPGTNARIRIKVNALTDEAVIEELYTASQHGAKIEIVARSICMLKPGVPGMSENISVRSIVGRYLEHSRMYGFEIGDDVDGLHRQRRPDDEEPRPADRGRRPGRAATAASGADRDLRQLVRRHGVIVGARRRRGLDAAETRQGRAHAQPSTQPAATGALAHAPGGGCS